MSAKMALTSDGGWAAPADAELMHELLGLMATDKVRAAFALSFLCHGTKTSNINIDVC